MWFSGHPGGDTMVVQQADVDVRDSAWWLTSASPPAERERIVTSAWIKVDGVAYEAGFRDDDQLWQISASPSTGPPSLALVLLDDSRFRRVLSPPHAEVTRQKTINGGSPAVGTPFDLTLLNIPEDFPIGR